MTGRRTPSASDRDRDQRKRSWGLAVLLSNAGDGRKRMRTGAPNTTYLDVSEHGGEAITSDADGWAEFRCPGRSVSVWVPQRG